MKRLFEVKKNNLVYPEYIKDSKFCSDNLEKIYKTGNMLQYHAFKIYAEVADIILQVNYFNFDNMLIKSKYLGKADSKYFGETENKVKPTKNNNGITTYTLDSVIDDFCKSNDPKDKQLLRGGLKMACNYIEYKKQENPLKYEIVVPTETDYYGVKVDGQTMINKLDFAKAILMKKYLPYTAEAKVLEKVLTRDDNGMVKIN